MDITFRPAKPGDFAATEYLTREAFWDVYKPGCDEHLLLHNIRKSNCYIADLDLVALENEKIIGHIICTRAKVVDKDMIEHEVLCAGPFAVLPILQKKGAGSALMLDCIARARAMGYKAIILFGKPEYYNRFGYVNAERFRISTRDGINFEPFMALELLPGALNDISGRFFEDDCFSVKADELAEFERQFPFREKHVLPTQLNL
jgi:predicted N-acetyltransferase YhbS